MICVEVKGNTTGTSTCRCTVEGSLKELTIQTLEAVHSIYKAMAEDGAPPEALVAFKFRVMDAVGHPFSPVWDMTTSKPIMEGEGDF